MKKVFASIAFGFVLVFGLLLATDGISSFAKTGEPAQPPVYPPVEPDPWLPYSVVIPSTSK